MLIIDTETTGLNGYPTDRVLEIGIAEYDEQTGKISSVYSEMIRYEDIRKFDEEYVNRDGSAGIWIYKHSDMRIEETLNAAKDLATVVDEVRDIVRGKEVTSYNVGFDFAKFLYEQPWDLKPIVVRKIDIMDLATKEVMRRARSDSLPDKELQTRLIREEDESKYPVKWVRSEDAYRALCPEDPMDLEKQTHRALDDAVMEAWILKALVEE